MAFELLDISLDNISEINIEYIKKKYHKMALLHHPDRNGNSIESKQQFQQINEAYEYLIKNEFNVDDNHDFVSSSSYNNPNIYINILTSFLSSILQSSYNEVFINVIKDIVLGGYNHVSMKIFDSFDKEKSIDIYNFLYKNRIILYISNETLQLVSSIIQEKYKDDRVFILNPSINDLMDSNVYKLYVDEKLYLVPLWHNELYFSSDIGDIIVTCNPNLHNGLTIDENNNIYIEKTISFNSLLLIDEFVSLDIGGKLFKIPCNELYIKRKQIYRLYNKGIAKIIEHDIYNVSFRSDIFVSIILVE